jgi:hypothetical protein
MSAPRCSVCLDPRCDQMDRLLVAGLSARAVANQYALGRGPMDRHKKAHLSPALRAIAIEKTTVSPGAARALLDRIGDVVAQAETILAQATADKRSDLALRAVQQCLAGLALYGKATGELKPDGQVLVQTVNVLQDPQMLAVMAVLDRILTPGQRVQLADALDGMDQGAARTNAPRQLSAALGATTGRVERLP